MASIILAACTHVLLTGAGFFIGMDQLQPQRYGDLLVCLAGCVPGPSYTENTNKCVLPRSLHDIGICLHMVLEIRE